MKFLQSLRFKIMLATVVASIASVLVIFFITPNMVEQRFLDEAKNSHLQNFSFALSEFKNSTKNWNSQQAAIDYYHSHFLPHRQSQLNTNRVPNHFRPGTPPPRQDSRQLRQNREQPLASENFRFVLTNPAGYVVLPFYQYQAGQLVDKNELNKAEPLFANGELVGYALPTGEAKLTEKDETYLTALTDSLIIAAFVAVFIAILISLLLTHSIQTRLKKLISATQDLATQSKPEQLNMSGNDEISLLANKFDLMSDKLLNQFNELENSHQIISAQAKNLEKLSFTDELTDLANRRYFNNQFKYFLAESETLPISLILCDIDYFKKVNDHFSHQIGDQVLHSVAQIITSSVREQDLAARIGGEELAVLMPKTDKTTALKIAERIRQNIENHDWHSIALGLKVTLSSGVACSTELTAPTESTLFSLADNQLYNAKSGGRNLVCG